MYPMLKSFKDFNGLRTIDYGQQTEKMRNYRKIQAWQLADDLTVNIYKITRGFPSEEKFGVISQIRRSAYSVPANISEGSARESKKDYLHFLYIARSSLTETQYFVHLSKRLGYLSEEKHNELMESVTDTFKRLHGLIKAVEKEVSSL